MAYIGKSPDGTGVRSRFYYTQTSGGGTSVSGSSDDGTSLAFSDGAYVDVFLNGVLLVAGTDYNTSTANTIAGLAALANGDVVEVVVYDIFTVADTVSALNGGTFSSSVAFNGGLTATDMTMSDAGAPTITMTDTTNTVSTVLKAGNTLGFVGTITNHPFEIRSNNVSVLNLTNDGKVGIQTTSPTSALTVRAFEDSTNGGIRFESADGTENATIDINNSANFRFRQNGNDRFRFDSSGRLMMGTTSFSVPFGEAFLVDGNDGHRVLCSRGSTASREQIIFYNPNGDVGSIDTSGSSTSYNTSSDHRLKENVADMTGAIDRVKQLAPKRFNFIADADTTVDGFLAHEAQAVVPEAVTGTKDEVDDDGNAVMQGIDQSKLVPLLTAALREAIAKIETLETKVAALESGS